MIACGLIAFYLYGSSSLISEDTFQSKVIFNEPVNTSQYQEGDTLSAMTYNIGYLSGMTNNTSAKREKEFFDLNLNAAIELIKELNPDILGLQEIDFDANRSFHIHQGNQLGEQAGFIQGFHSVNWNKKYVPFPYDSFEQHFGSMLSGQSLLSKHPLNNSTYFTMERPVNAPFYYNAFYLDRLIQVSELEIGGRIILVMNLHLEAFDKETRMLHAKSVQQEYLKYYKEFPVLILGDFNSRTEYLDKDAMHFIMQSPDIRSAIDRTQYETDSTHCYSYSSAHPEYMIDYILYNHTKIEKVSANVIQYAGQISDHFPVVFDFILKD